MSGVVTPPPRPPRPYLPAQNRKDGSKSTAKREDRANEEPSPGHGRSTGNKLVGCKVKQQFSACYWYLQILQVPLNGPIHSAVVVTFHHVLSVQSGRREQDLKPPLVERVCLQRDQFHLPQNWKEDNQRNVPTLGLHWERVNHKVRTTVSINY